MGKAARSNQIIVNQASHSIGDAISLGSRVISYTVKCHPQSPSNVFVGINEDASEGNLLEPGDSVTISLPSLSSNEEDIFIDDKLYIGFDDTASSQGRALIIILRRTEKEIC
jgi:hypothetical protein